MIEWKSPAELGRADGAADARAGKPPTYCAGPVPLEFSNDLQREYGTAYAEAYRAAMDGPPTAPEPRRFSGRWTKPIGRA